MGLNGEVTHPEGFVGLEAVHVVGPPDAPGTQELQQVDLHRRLHEDEVVVGHAEAGKVEKIHDVS